MLKKQPLPCCGTLPPTTLYLFKNHDFTFWKRSIDEIVKLENKNAILARLLIHLKQRKDQKHLIQLVEKNIQYVDSSGNLLIRRRLFRNLVAKSLPKAITMAQKYPLYLEEKEREAHQIAA